MIDKNDNFDSNIYAVDECSPNRVHHSGRRTQEFWAGCEEVLHHAIYPEYHDRSVRKEFGVQLFDRSTKPVSITKEGDAIIPQLRIIQNELGQLDSILQLLKGEMAGDLKIGILPTVAPYLLPEFLNDFASKFPQIQFSVSEMTTDIITEQLVKRELDVGIFSDPFGARKPL